MELTQPRGAMFLRKRSDSKNDQFTPLITMPNGDRISTTMAQELGFKFVPLFHHTSRYIACQVEWGVQERFDDLPTDGTRRLWTKTGAGAKYLNVVGDCKVYLCISFEVQDALKKEIIIRGDPELSKKYDKDHKMGIFYEGKRNHRDDSTDDDDIDVSDLELVELNDLLEDGDSEAEDSEADDSDSDSDGSNVAIASQKLRSRRLNNSGDVPTQGSSKRRSSI